jgi:hypothetical protein
MANDADEWTPEKPLEDKKLEEDCQTEARARARVTYLQKQYEKEKEPEKGKRRTGYFR